MSAGKEVVQPCKAHAETLLVIPGGERVWLRVLGFCWLAKVAPVKILGTGRSCLALAISQLVFDRYANVAVDRD